MMPSSFFINPIRDALFSQERKSPRIYFQQNLDPVVRLNVNEEKRDRFLPLIDII